MQYLYLIKCQQFHKIGIANDVESRLAQLSTGNPYPLEVVIIYAFENAEIVERAIHQRYKETRKRGEWFSLSYEDLKNIHTVCLALGGSAFEYTGQDATEEVIEESEDEQEFFLDNPSLRIEKRMSRDGVVRGFAFRERHNGRKVIKYIGSRESPDEFSALIQVLAEKPEAK